jgi:pimeloyl-ACP methyl ester carboxylesterase
VCTDAACSPQAGLEEVARLVPRCASRRFDGCNHWLYLEEPARFAEALSAFAAGI